MCETAYKCVFVLYFSLCSKVCHTKSFHSLWDTKVSKFFIMIHVSMFLTHAIQETYPMPSMNWFDQVMFFFSESSWLMSPLWLRCFVLLHVSLQVHFTYNRSYDQYLFSWELHRCNGCWLLWEIAIKQIDKSAPADPTAIAAVEVIFVIWE